MHFKHLLYLTFFVTLTALSTSCDNTVIEPKLQDISTNPIDSQYAHLKLQYAFTSDIRILKLVYYTKSYKLGDYTHILTFDDGSKMTLESNNDFGTGDVFNCSSATSISGYQGYYVRMDFYDKFKNEHYAFKDQSSGLTINNKTYNSKYLLVYFNNNYTTWQGYTTTKAIFSGTLAVLQ